MLLETVKWPRTTPQLDAIDCLATCVHMVLALVLRLQLAVRLLLQSVMYDSSLCHCRSGRLAVNGRL
jgi:hypothetical protein